jgi:SAM-dependent methyltransferase
VTTDGQGLARSDQENRVDQTQRSFGEKWANNPKLLLAYDQMVSSGSLNWIMERNGFDGADRFSEWIRGRQRILDAGCGNGRVTSAFAKFATESAEIVGIDINSAVAAENLAADNRVNIFEVDLLSDLGFLGKFDLIYCQEVLHHTDDPKRVLKSLASLLNVGGELAVYVYKVKAPVREFVDDHVRNQVAHLNYTDSLPEMRAITEIGRVLSELKSVIQVPEIASLGIDAGTYDLQRFVYHFFMKCFWNEAMSFDENVAINYDWYHPAVASRHTLQEVNGWFAEAGLAVLHECVDHYGITIRGQRV